jgi:hypothetical protein
MGMWLALWLHVASAAVMPQEVPDPRWRGGWVSDEALVLSKEARARIDARGDGLARETRVELVLVSVLDVPGTPAAMLSDLFARWELGAHRSRGAVFGLWVADRSEWAWRVGAGIDRDLGSIRSPSESDLERWYHQVAQVLEAPRVDLAADGAPRALARRTLHPWWYAAALGLFAVLVLLGGDLRRVD